jgi:hypothetical protein
MTGIMRCVRGRTCFLQSILICMVLLTGGSTVMAEEKVRIGIAEEVVLLPWGVRMPARVDTGAATSSMDARNVKVEGRVVEFNLPEKYGGMKLRLPIVDWKYIRSSEAREKRPVVEVDLCVGSKQLRARVNLNDRSRVKYPMILGRNVLQRGFIVDCEKDMCAPPSCPEVSSQ